MKDLPVILVAAMNRMGYIGNEDGDLIHKNSRDLQRFKDLSINGVLIMGRKTYESLPKALPSRSFVVVSERMNRADIKHPAGCDSSTTLFIGDIGRAMEAAHRIAEAKGHDKIVIAGGASVFAHFLPQVEYLHLTHFDSEELGDAMFPIEQVESMIADERFVQTNHYEFYDGEMKVRFKDYELAPCIESRFGDFVKLANGVRFRLSQLQSYFEAEDHILIAQTGFAVNIMDSEMNLGQLMKELDELVHNEPIYIKKSDEELSYPKLKLAKNGE